MRHESTDKHGKPWQQGRRGSLCPKTIGPKTAQALLSGSVAVGNKRYAVHDRRAYCAHKHGVDLWHGYPVGWGEVPKSLRETWRKEGRVRRRDMKKTWELP